MLPPAVLLLILTACSLTTPILAARLHPSRTLQDSTAPSYNTTAGSVNGTVGSSSSACSSYNGTVSGCNATVGSYSAAAAQNVSAQAHNATNVGHNAGTAATPLPPQHLFQHGRKCGLQHINSSDQAAARAVKPHTGIAEGGVSIVVQVPAWPEHMCCFMQHNAMQNDSWIIYEHLRVCFHMFYNCAVASMQPGRPYTATCRIWLL